MLTLFSNSMQDSDERAVAYIAGKAPNRWGPFGAKEAPSATPMLVVPPVLPPPNATAAQLARASEIRRAHPLYADVTLRLLTEIMNSRLFTTVCFLDNSHCLCMGGVRSLARTLIALQGCLLTWHFTAGI